MKIYHIMLLSLVYAVNSIVAMELAPELSLCTLPDVLITRIAARLEQKDKQSFCLVN